MKRGKEQIGVSNVTIFTEIIRQVVKVPIFELCMTVVAMKYFIILKSTSTTVFCERVERKEHFCENVTTI